MGVKPNNVVLCDSKGVIYKGRTEGMNQGKSAHAAETTDRTLADAMPGADVVFGLSVAGAVTQDVGKSMVEKPITLSMAHPNPEHRPGQVKAVLYGNGRET